MLPQCSCFRSPRGAAVLRTGPGGLVFTSPGSSGVHPGLLSHYRGEQGHQCRGLLALDVSGGAAPMACGTHSLAFPIC